MNPHELAAKASEHAEQRALFAWANMASNYGFKAANDMKCYKDKEYTESTYGEATAHPCLKFMFAIPNGGKRDKITAAKLKAEGVKPGVCDIFLPQPIRKFCGLFIEMKKLKDSKPTEEQVIFINEMQWRGYAAHVAKGWEAAALIIQTYLE